MAKLKPLKIIKEENEVRDYLKDKVDKIGKYANSDKAKYLENKVTSSPTYKKIIKTAKDVDNHAIATDAINRNGILGNIKMSANKLGEKITDHSHLADQASHHIGNDGVGYATAGVGLAALGGAIHLARKKIRSSKPVHEAEQPNNDPDKWKRRATKVVKYGLGAAAVGGLANAALGGGIMAHHVGGSEVPVPSIDHGQGHIASQAGERLNALVHNQNLHDMNVKKNIIGGAMVAGGLGTTALYGSGAYLAHKKAKELEVKKKQDK